MGQVIYVAEDDPQRTADAPLRGDRVRRRYDHGFAQVPRALLTNEPSPSSNAVHCFALLDMHADYQTGACYPAQSTLMREMGVSNKTVRRALDELETLGFIARYPRVDPRYGRIGTDYDLLATPTMAADPPWSPVTRGGGAGDQGGWSQVTTKQETKGNKTRDNKQPGTPDPSGDVVVSAASPPDPNAGQVQALLATLAPDVPAATAEQWLSEHGTQVVVEHLGWLKAEIDAGRRVNSRGGWLRDSFGWSEPPMSYRRVQREQERQVQREATRQAELTQAEQAAALAEEGRQRLQAVRATYKGLPADRQTEIDAAARAAVAAGPAGSMVDVPPIPDAWEERTIGAVLWRQAVGEILRDGGGMNQ